MSLNYQETLDFLYKQLPMFSRIGAAAYKKDLTNTLALCQEFGNPQTKFTSIHIGGTNGKGSTTHYLASMFINAGKNVGIYTSPHLIDFRERIKINNQMIPQDFVIDFVEKAKPLIETIQPSFFELTVVMAFEYFAREKVDIALVEVGLGGRLDSTNVLSPALCVITNVSLDHMNMLGNTVAEIAVEKAGIIKQQTPVIIGEWNTDYNKIFEEKAADKQAILSYASKEVEYKEKNDFVLFSTKDIDIQLPLSAVEPPYQIKNIKTSILSFLTYYSRLNSDTKSLQQWITQGIEHRTQNTNFLGRWTKIDYQQRNFILESAHNEAGILELKNTIEHQSISDAIIIFGCVSDKDASKVVSLLPKNFRYILTQAAIPRAMDVKDLAPLFANQNLEIIYTGNTIADAVQQAIILSSLKQKIIVTGSIFVVGEALSYLQ